MASGMRECEMNINRQVKESYRLLILQQTLRCGEKSARPRDTVDQEETLTTG